MQNDEQVFDYMAAAEETGRQLDLMVRQVPGHIKTALTDEWRKMPMQTELSEATRKLNDVIKETREATLLLRQTTWAIFVAGIFAAIVIPVAIWILTKQP